MQTLPYPVEQKTYFAKRFALWLGIASMVMMFAGFTSAYIVKKADAATWFTFDIPVLFYYSTGLILISSVFMHFAVKSFKNNNVKRYHQLLKLTLLTGTGFLITQFLGWNYLVSQGIFLTTVVSGDFFYVISGMHAAHVLGGVLILVITIISISKKLKNPVYHITQEVSPDRKFRAELMATYWHFVDFLWIYLFIFLMYNHSN